jgi:hypothetical protein
MESPHESPFIESLSVDHQNSTSIANVNLISPIDSAPLVYVQNTPSVNVRWNEPHCQIHLPGKLAVAVTITADMLPIKRLDMSLTGKDQGG